MKVTDLLQSATMDLTRAGVENSAVDAEVLLGHCLDKSRTELYLHAKMQVTDTEVEKFSGLLKRRLLREPVAYILSNQEFWSLDFFVSPHVLIPRPETELLLERGLAFYRQNCSPQGLLLDLCCGSGIIAIVLACELGVPVIATDISEDALRIARINAKRHGVSHLVSFVQADLLSAFQKKPSFSMVLSNPPYVSRQEMEEGLQPEVDLFEPHLALDGGEDGYEIIERIGETVLSYLLPKGGIFMEIGTEQGKRVETLLTQGAKDSGESICAEIVHDYNGHERIFTMCKEN